MGRGRSTYLAPFLCLDNKARDELTKIGYLHTDSVHRVSDPEDFPVRKLI